MRLRPSPQTQSLFCDLNHSFEGSRITQTRKDWSHANAEEGHIVVVLPIAGNAGGRSHNLVIASSNSKFSAGYGSSCSEANDCN